MSAAPSSPSVPDTAAPSGPVPVALAVTAAGAVAQLVGLLARSAAEPGSPRHDGGGALVVVGLVVVLAGLGWQLAPWAGRLATTSRRGALVVALTAGGVLMVAGIAIGRGLEAGGRVGDLPAVAVPTTAGTTAPPPTATGSSGAATGAGERPGIGAVIASQGYGSNSPPPSIEGVTFPSGGGRGASGDDAPSWAASGAVVSPVTVPPDTTPSTAGPAGTAPSGTAS